VLSGIPNQTIQGNSFFIVTNAASDSDLPANNLTYQLAVAPSGALIDASGIITWTAGSSASTNVFQTIVNDNGVPPLLATNIFTVVVNAVEIVPPPVIQSITVSGGEAVLTWTSVSNHSYRAQFVEKIDASIWSNLVPDISATGPTSTVTNTTGDSKSRFYRVILLP
jgi:hypothetical protein